MVKKVTLCSQNKALVDTASEQQIGYNFTVIRIYFF